MKKYYMSFVDFSEILNVTADEAQLKKAESRMAELGLLTEKGNPSPAQIGAAVGNEATPFFDKLNKRIARRPGGIVGVRDTMQKLYGSREYTALFLYLAILYGFLQWQVPEKLLLLPAVPDALKLFEGDLLAAFDSYSTPAGARIRMEFYIPSAEAYRLQNDSGASVEPLEISGESCLVGAMLWGRPISRYIDQKAILELTRCCFLDFMPRNTESMGLAKARAWIRKNCPEVKGLIAYASSAEKHKGVIYLADGWFKIAETHSAHASWETRENRTDRDLSVKYKFARSP